MRAALAALLFAAGCATPPPAADAPQSAQEATDQDTCGVSRFAHLIGTPASEIDRASLPPRARIIEPNSIVTMDFSAERLNIITGTDGRVGSLRCF